MKSLPINIRLLLLFIILFMVFGTLLNSCNTATDIYNSHIRLRNQYQRKVEAQISTYDAYYLAFKDKMDVTNLNKDVFIEVTNIIMSSRKDGQQVAWKWLQENQQIPYSEFTVFYKELSSFISTRYSEQLSIETDKQTIVNEHNNLIEMFPNNMYNKLFLHINKLEYKSGYVSEETKLKFQN